MNPPTPKVHPLRVLIETWCDRRDLKPLSILLPAYLGLSELTDSIVDLRNTLRHLKSTCRDSLPEDELAVIHREIVEIDKALAAQ